MVSGTRYWESLERWSPTLFLVGGGLVVGHAAVRGIEAFTATAPPPDVFGPPGYLLALLGVLGLYPALVERTPRVARLAAVVALVPLVGWVGLSAVSFAAAAGVSVVQAPEGLGGLFVAHIVGVVLTYVLFGLASLRAGVHSRSIGLLLLMPPVLMGGMLAGAAVMGYSAIGAFVIGGAQALVHLTIGGVLRGNPTETQAPAGDVMAG